MTRSRMWLLAAALILVPSTAQAQVWWDFIESLSGPGPFQGAGFYVRLARGKQTASARRGRSTGCTNASTIPTPGSGTSLNPRTVPDQQRDRPRLLVSPADTRPVHAHKWDGSRRFASFPHWMSEPGVERSGSPVRTSTRTGVRDHPSQCDLHTAGGEGRNDRIGRIF